jgi:Endomembrane protein 70
MVSTYIQLLSHDYRWGWRRFWVGAGAGLVLAAYSYYFYQDQLFDTSISSTRAYFAYMTTASMLLANLLGAAGFLASSKVVSIMFDNAKVD